MRGFEYKVTVNLKEDVKKNELRCLWRNTAELLPATTRHLKTAKVAEGSGRQGVQNNLNSASRTSVLFCHPPDLRRRCYLHHFPFWNKWQNVWSRDLPLMGKKLPTSFKEDFDEISFVWKAQIWESETSSQQRAVNRLVHHWSETLWPWKSPVSMACRRCPHRGFGVSFAQTAGELRRWAKPLPSATSHPQTVCWCLFPISFLSKDSNK